MDDGDESEKTEEMKENVWESEWQNERNKKEAMITMMSMKAGIQWSIWGIKKECRYTYRNLSQSWMLDQRGMVEGGGRTQLCVGSQWVGGPRLSYTWEKGST